MNEITIIDEAAIRKRVEELALSIARDFAGTQMVMVGILNGSFIFMADLMRCLFIHNLQPRIDFMTVSSYGGETYPQGEIRMVRDVSVNVQGAAALIVDDILDTGWTMHYVKKRLAEMGARMVKTCVLLNKSVRREADIRPDYIGFEVENKFVVGYGLDYNGFHREKPYIAVLEGV